MSCDSEQLSVIHTTLCVGFDNMVHSAFYCVFEWPLNNCLKHASLVLMLLSCMSIIIVRPLTSFSSNVLNDAVH